MILAKSGKLKGAEFRWIEMFIQMMELLHQKTFREYGINKRIFAVDDSSQYAARYLPSAHARSEVPDKLQAGEDAYFVNVERFMEHLNLSPTVYPLLLGVNRGRPIPKYLYIALMALHETRHCAQFRLKPHIPSIETFSEKATSLISKRNRRGFKPFMKKWRSFVRVVRKKDDQDFPRYERDAQQMEGIGLFLWEYDKIRGVELLTSHFPHIILLGTKSRR